MRTALWWIGANGRLILVVSLILGILFNDWAGLIKPWMPAMVLAILYFTSLRVGVVHAFSDGAPIAQSLWVIALLQVAAPFAYIGVAAALGLNLGDPFWMAVALTLAAPSITGAPNFVILIGGNPDQSLKIMLIGTLLFPLTIIPVLYFVPNVTGGSAIALSAIKVAGAILIAFGASILTQRFIIQNPDKRALDGISTSLLAVVVIGLMAEIKPNYIADPIRVLWTMAGVFVLNLGAQIVTALGLRRYRGGNAMGDAIQAGNRNIALYLIALPPDLATIVMVYIGCYQVPMYLTPLTMRPFYGRFVPNYRTKG